MRPNCPRASRTPMWPWWPTLTGIMSPSASASTLMIMESESIRNSKCTTIEMIFLPPKNTTLWQSQKNLLKIGHLPRKKYLTHTRRPQSYRRQSQRLHHSSKTLGRVRHRGLKVCLRIHSIRRILKLTGLDLACLIRLSTGQLFWEPQEAATYIIWSPWLEIGVWLWIKHLRERAVSVSVYST